MAASRIMDNYRCISEEEGNESGFGKFSVTLIPHYQLQMSDGVNLSLKIWFPFNDVKYTTFEECEHKLIYQPEEPANAVPQPSIFEYLPYRKSDVTLNDDWRHLWMSTQGYVCVRIDLRGTGDSGGLCFDEYTEQEIKDGMEVIEWLSEQPWCNGDVGVYGRGWGGTNGLLLAAQQPPGLRAVISMYATDDRYAVDSHYLGGCILANEQISRASQLMAWNARPPNPRHVTDWREQWRMRLEQASESWLGTWLRHRNRDKYWEMSSIAVDPQKVMVPALLIGGWQDYRAGRLLRMASTLPRMRGVIGPWGGDWPDQHEQGPNIDLLGLCLTWWDEHLKGVGIGTMYQTPLLRVFLQEPHGESRTPKIQLNDKSEPAGVNATNPEIAADNLKPEATSADSQEIQTTPTQSEGDVSHVETELAVKVENPEGEIDLSAFEDVLGDLQMAQNVTGKEQQMTSDSSLPETKPDVISAETETGNLNFSKKVVYRSKSHTEWYVPLEPEAEIELETESGPGMSEAPESTQQDDLKQQMSLDWKTPEKEVYNFIPETRVSSPPPQRMSGINQDWGKECDQDDNVKDCMKSETGVIIERKENDINENGSDTSVKPMAGRWVPLDHWPPKMAGTWVDMAPSCDGGMLWLLTVGERDERCGSHTWSVPYNRGHGLGAADWGSMTGSGPPGPQQVEDGVSLTWTSRALEEDLVILGQPRLSCRVRVSGGTQGMLVARLCHVTPEGISHRVSFAVHNLTHRLGHHESVPLKDGEAGDLAISMIATSYTVPRGHRVRLALAQSYWPLLWTPQKALEMDIEVGQLQGSPETFLTLLTIPVYRENEQQQERPLGLGSPRKPPPCILQVEKPGSAKTLIEWSPSDGRYCVRSKANSDRVSLPETGTIMEESVAKVFVLENEDPTSARVCVDHHVTHEHKDIPGGDTCCDIKTHTQMWSSAHAFTIHNSLDVSVNGEVFFGESWNSTIPRTGV